jgi:hypothetical protein
VAGTCECGNEHLGSVKEGNTSLASNWLNVQEGLCCVE